jgi:CubicO group peptidase (beta-lactamase class C family)
MTIRAVTLTLCLCAAVARAQPSPELEASTLEAQGFARAPFLQLATFLRDHPYPVFSILVSRNDKLVFELYTSSLGGDEAHYLMSVTKSVLSALIGIAIDRHLIASTEATIADLLPSDWFPGDGDRARFRALSLAQVMGMSGIDTPDPPLVRTPEATARYQAFWSAPRRVVVALARPLLHGGFQYNDSNPTLAVGALAWTTKKSPLAFAEETLFSALGFRNYEWMHQDASGLDNGGYGLRLRPIDMHKFGLLYLHEGSWHGRQVISKAWVAQSFRPWNRSKPDLAQPDYGSFWWARDYGDGWQAHVAIGWKGQRIAVFPAQKIVVTMTACVEDGTDGEFFDQLVTRVLKPALAQGGGAKPSEPDALTQRLADVRRTPPRYQDFIEYRMVPSVTPKQRRVPLKPLLER